MEFPYETLEKVLQEYQDELSEAPGSWSHEVKRAMDYINKNLFDPNLTITTIKEECLIRNKSFHYRFRKYAGKYPKQYIIYHRLKMAKYLLVYTKLSVTEIGIEIGFTTLSSFCNTFKNKVGLRPSEWRQLNGFNK